jgi:hypothetical protein
LLTFFKLSCKSIWLLCFSKFPWVSQRFSSKYSDKLGTRPQKVCQPCYSIIKPDRSPGFKESLYSQNFVRKPRILRTTVCRTVRSTYLSALQKSILAQTTCRQNSTWIFPTNEQTAGSRQGYYTHPSTINFIWATFFSVDLYIIQYNKMYQDSVRPLFQNVVLRLTQRRFLLLATLIKASRHFLLRRDITRLLCSSTRTVQEHLSQQKAHNFSHVIISETNSWTTQTNSWTNQTNSWTTLRTEQCSCFCSGGYGFESGPRRSSIRLLSPAGGCWSRKKGRNLAPVPRRL